MATMRDAVAETCCERVAQLRAENEELRKRAERWRSLAYSWRDAVRKSNADIDRLLVAFDTGDPQGSPPASAPLPGGETT